MTDLAFRADVLKEDIVGRGYGLVDHDVPPDVIEAAIEAYANFTDNHPNPKDYTMNSMLVDQNALDELDYSQDKQGKKWHKFRTNYPWHAKPDGFTDRSYEVEILRQYGRTVLGDEGSLLEDDPKEYYHYHPGSDAILEQRHVDFEWGPIPPEVYELHRQLKEIHEQAVISIEGIFRALESDHPGLLSTRMSHEDLLVSPLRLLFYHPGQGPTLAAPHFDKAGFTMQIAESHIGLRVENPQTENKELVRRSADSGVVFPGLLWPDFFPQSDMRPAWHDVINLPELNDGRDIRGLNCARWALIFFANDTKTPVPQKEATHNR
ncbi:MAG TPA: hypothetical protein VMR18_02250 [Candidatus Saccharimonadales bacterium]|nr:hypothetical protein [Candidatus Saccharimonadales bacterium]